MNDKLFVHKFSKTDYVVSCELLCQAIENLNAKNLYSNFHLTLQNLRQKFTTLSNLPDTSN